MSLDLVDFRLWEQNLRFDCEFDRLGVLGVRAQSRSDHRCTNVGAKQRTVIGPLVDTYGPLTSARTLFGNSVNLE